MTWHDDRIWDDPVLEPEPEDPAWLEPEPEVPLYNPEVWDETELS